jgi:hypothetical protein
MARQLMLVYNSGLGFSPNYENGLHFVFTDPNIFLDWIKDHTATAYLTQDNYRINTGIVKISKKSYAALNWGSDITYMVDYDYDSVKKKFNYWRCYRVLSFIEQSDMIIYDCEVDNWGTYIWQANFDHLRVRRCNHILKNHCGFFDPITSVKSRELSAAAYEPLYQKATYPVIPHSETFSSDDLYIVFVAQAAVGTTATGENVTATYVLGQKVSTIASFWESARSDHSDIEIAIRAVSGIFGSTSDLWIDNKVQVVSAFLTPYWSGASVSSPLYLKTKTPYDPTNVKEILFDYMAMERRTTDYVLSPDDIDNNYDYYIGTKNNGLRLEQTTDDMHVNIIEEMDTNGYHVLVKQGTRAKDISKCFQVSLMGSTKEYDALSSLSFWLKSIASHLPLLAAGIATSIATENPLPAIGAGIGALSSSVSNLSGNNNVTPFIESDSDGYMTFTAIDRRSASYPFYMTKYESAANESNNARIYGVAFDAYYSDLKQLSQNATDFIGTPINDYFYTRSFFVSGDAVIEGVPIVARNEITDAINNGVHIWFLYE